MGLGTVDRVRKWRWCVVAAALLVAGLIALPARAETPVPFSFAAGVAAELTAPGSPPPGANDWACRPSSVHPRPVVLVHGTVFDMTLTWQALSIFLIDNGYCVFALDYGGASPTDPVGGLAPVEDSAQVLSAFVDRVLASTGAAQVDLVGHSQGGGVLPRYYIGFLGGAPKVHALVGLAPSNHGTTVSGLIPLLDLVPGDRALAFGTWCAACVEQFNDSPFLQKLNGIGDTVAGVSYTVIATRYDEIVTPYQTQFLSGPDVTNITLQDQCAEDFTDHVGITYDQVALRDVLDALDPAHALAPTCAPVLPVLGG
jgi:triacylglycerol esterase/lipase EstA (alpha/beta hydrolase family)